jgi:hypothetical protein
MDTDAGRQAYRLAGLPTGSNHGTMTVGGRTVAVGNGG